MQASEIMTRDVVAVRRDTPLHEVVRLMLAHRVSGLPVVEDERVVGIVSEGDLLRRPETGTERPRGHWLELVGSAETEAAEYVRTHGVTAGEVMTAEVVSVADTTQVEAIAEVLESHAIKRVAVLRAGKLVGLVSRADLLRSLGAKLPPQRGQSDADIRAALLEELAGHATWAPLPAEVSVVVQDGVVYYRGCVHSTAQREAMIVAARRVAGVTRVEDHMVLRNAPPPQWPSFDGD